MAFKTYLYEGQDGTSSYKIKIDSDQHTIAGAVVGTPTQSFHVVLSKSRRRYGLHPRHIVFTREEGAAQDGTGKIHYTRLAMCTEAAYAALPEGTAVQINGIAWKVASQQPEFLR